MKIEREDEWKEDAENQETHRATGEHCHCDVCAGKIADMSAWEADKMEKAGFYAHMVAEEDGYLNAHTHGFETTWNHPDVQIVLPIPGNVVMSLFWTIADHIKAGKKYEADQTYEEVVKDFRVKIVWARDGERPVLRVLLPDAEGRLPGEDGCSESFERQLAAAGGIQEGEKA